jgi:lipoprotein-anchoring transpeptidase ErfK/SrfK
MKRLLFALAVAAFFGAAAAVSASAQPLTLGPDFSYTGSVTTLGVPVATGITLLPQPGIATFAAPAGLTTVTQGSQSASEATPYIEARFLPALVAYNGAEPPGTVIVDTVARYLYLVEPGNLARRYGVGVGRPGFEWAGEHLVTRKAEWPGWWPPEEMKERQPELPDFMPGGPDNPLGARALYLGYTLYRIHGTNQPWTIGQAVSSGCIRMRNEDVIDLYERVAVGARVIVI